MLTPDASRFRCTGCGECCRRVRVPITHRDLERLTRGTERPAADLIEWLAPEEIDMDGEPESFVELREGRRLMVLRYADGACVLLGADNLCSAYASRPSDCRLYPFDVDRKDPAAPLRLLPLAGCDYVSDGDNSLQEVTRLDAERWAELSAYQGLVAAYNRLALRKRRFGHALGSAREFLAYLGLA